MDTPHPLPHPTFQQPPNVMRNFIRTTLYHIHVNIAHALTILFVAAVDYETTKISGFTVLLGVFVHTLTYRCTLEL